MEIKDIKKKYISSRPWNLQEVIWVLEALFLSIDDMGIRNILQKCIDDLKYALEEL